MTDAGRVAADPPRAASGSTRSVAAYDAYLRGRAQYDLSADETSERAALAQFDAAIAADPGYAAAHAARARSLTAIANQYGEVAELAGAVRRRRRLGPSRHRPRARPCGSLLDARVHALPGPPRCARGPRAIRAIARTGLRRGHGHGALCAVQRAHRAPVRGQRCHRARAAARPAESAHPPCGRRPIEFAARNFAESIPHARVRSK